MNRAATTLIEVLIAIFIMALGLVALLTLFPLGAIQMARAVQDERAAQVGANSAAMFRSYWKTVCEEAATTTRNGDMMFQFDPNMPPVNSNQANLQPTMRLWFPYAMDDPNAGIMSQNLTIQTSAAVMPGMPPAALMDMNMARTNSMAMSVLNRPSWPVYVDPVGWEAGGRQTQMRGLWMGSSAPAGQTGVKYAIPRRSMSEDTWKVSHLTRRDWAPMALNKVLRMFTLLDDTDFDPNGIAGVAQRRTQYSTAWMLRRDQNNRRGDIGLTVVVYYNRSVGSLSEEPTFMTPAGMRVEGRSVTLEYPPGARPAVRRGGWILDATMNPTNNNVQGFFYRVTDIGEEQSIGGMMSIDLQLETPLRRGEPLTVPPEQRMFVVPAQVLEVFEKGPMDMDSPTRVN